MKKLKVDTISNINLRNQERQMIKEAGLAYQIREEGERLQREKEKLLERTEEIRRRNKEMGPKRLRRKQRKFVSALAMGLDMKTAAKESGYKVPPMQRQNVLEAISKLQEDATRMMSSKCAVTLETVTEEIQNAIEMAKERGLPMEIFAGLKMFVDLYGLNEPQKTNVEVNVNIPSERELDSLSDEELEALVSIGEKMKRKTEGE